MDQRADDIQQGIEETRQDIEETRSAMTEKLELLEERVRETVEGAKSTVEDIMENVKGTVGDTVEAVKETVSGAKSTVEDIVENVRGTVDDTVTMVKHTVDLNYQVEQRPWLMFGGSVLVGYLLGGLGSRGSYTKTAKGSYLDEPAYGTAYYSKPEAKPESPTPYSGDSSYRSYDSGKSGYYPPPYKTGMTGGVLSQFKEELDIIKGAAVGALMSTLRDMVRQGMPSLAPQLEKAINSATTKLGGQPVDDKSEQRTAAANKPATNPGSSYNPRQAGQGQPPAV